MPTAMAGNWLMIGAVMVVGLLVFSALLPRPSPEYAISALPDWTGSSEEGASPMSVGSEGVRDPQAGSDSGVDHSPDPASAQPPAQPDSSAGADTRHTSAGADGQAQGKAGSPSREKGSQGSAGKSGSQSEEKSPASSSNHHADEKPSSDQSGNLGTKASPQPGTKAQSQGTQPSNTPPPNTPPADNRDAKGSRSGADQPQSEQGQPAAPPPPSASDSSQPDSPPPAPPPTPPLPSPGLILDSLAGLFKMVLYAVLIGGVGYAAWRWRAELREIVAGWLAALRDFWRSFFGASARNRPLGR